MPAVQRFTLPSAELLAAAAELLRGAAATPLTCQEELINIAAGYGSLLGSSWVTLIMIGMADNTFMPAFYD